MARPSPHPDRRIPAGTEGFGGSADALSFAGARPTDDEGRPAARFGVVAIAASAGGLPALSSVLGGLSAEFPAPIVVVQHLDPRRRSLLAQILARRTALCVAQAEDGEKLVPGRVYVARPDRHLLVNADHTVALTTTELVHFVRPSADLLFDSVAASYRERAVAVVLTGSGSDGSSGVRAIKRMGGTVIVQDEATSDFYGMPGAALHSGATDLVLALDEIALALLALVPGDAGA